MKESSDKEIDSLLRRHVRAGAEARAGGDGARAPRTPAHLDADELSAFAEGALPAAARLAAVSHLADCDECRGLVVSLSRAEGELEKRAAATQVEPSRPARRREWLSALFAPRVLRYAAPVLALCLVAAVSFVALRSRQSNKELARRASSGEAGRAGAARVEEGGADDGALVSSNANTSANANVGVAPSETTSGETQAETAASASAGAPRAAQAAKGPNAEGETLTVTAEGPKRAEAPPPANERETAASAAPAPKPNSNEPSEAAKTESKEKDTRPSESQEQVAASDQPAQQAKQRSNQRNLEAVSPDDSRNQTRSVANNASGGASNNGARADALASTPREGRDKTERHASAPASRRARSADEKRAQTEEDEAALSEETRGVSGHRFRRAGGAWVDVNYKPSMPSTGVRRGTDAYRALVADIPEVGRVAEQLGGEVVVVIRGRAYRIR
jgi:hypothetical protein